VVPVAVARRESGEHEVRPPSKTDARRVRRGGTPVDCGTPGMSGESTAGVGGGGGGVREGRSLLAARPRRRRRSMFPLTAAKDHPTTWRQTSPRSRSQPNNSAPPCGFSLSEELRTSRQPRRSSCTPFSHHERFTATSNHTSSSSGTSVTDSSSTISTDPSSFLLQLQTKVKVSERPVRCLVNVRYYACGLVALRWLGQNEFVV